ncbi:MAG: carbon storage regulator [Planctomycetota bacterium]|nr:carbon storage regulator [Planctomycetota bacterium]
MLVLSRRRGQSIKIGPNISIIVLQTDGDSVRLGVKVPDDPGALACLCDPPLREFVERWRKRSELLDINTAL